MAYLFRSDPCVPTHDDTGEEHTVYRTLDVGVVWGGGWDWRGRWNLVDVEREVFSDRGMEELVVCG